MLTQQDPRIAGLHVALEEQYRLRTEQLTKLVTQSHRDDDAAAAAAASCRQALADIASALRSMAEGRYGDCEGCGLPIAIARLDVLPHARFCMPCQQRR